MDEITQSIRSIFIWPTEYENISVIYLIDEETVGWCWVWVFFSILHFGGHLVPLLFNGQASGMCKFGGNCHKQFGTNYLYVQSGFIVYLCVSSSLCIICLCLSACLRVYVWMFKSQFQKGRQWQPVMLKLLQLSVSSFTTWLNVCVCVLIIVLTLFAVSMDRD